MPGFARISYGKICVSVYTYISLFVFMYSCMYACMHACMYVNMYMYIHRYIYIYIYIYMVPPPMYPRLSSKSQLWEGVGTWDALPSSRQNGVDSWARGECL